MNTITQIQNKKKRAKNRRPSGKKPRGQPRHKGTTNKRKPNTTKDVKMDARDKCNLCYPVSSSA